MGEGVGENGPDMGLVWLVSCGNGAALASCNRVSHHFWRVGVLVKVSDVVRAVLRHSGVVGGFCDHWSPCPNGNG